MRCNNINDHVIKMGFIIVLFSTVLLTGCSKKFLDRQPLGAYTSDNYPYPQGGGPYDQYLFAASGDLRGTPTGFGFVGAVSIRSDDADKGSTPADAPDQIAMDNFSTMTPTVGVLNDLWTGYYNTIADCNTALDKVAKDSTNTSQATRSLAIGEAKFIRGYCYFMLVRLFGSVPIIDTVTTVSGSNVPQSSVSAVYSFIEQDLQYAAINLPLSWPASFIGRATQGSANGILAKVYLFEQKWNQAMATAEIVINSGVYNLNTPYNQIFTETGENCSESIFEIQAFASANHKEDSYGCQYANFQGVRGASWDNLGWGFNNPSPQLIAAYEAGDPRQASTVLYCPSPAPTVYNELFPVEPDPTYNMKVYTNPQVRATVGDMFGWWTNVRILRYPDVLLMYAEAANEISYATNGADAMTKLNMVRARARAGNNAILPDVTATTAPDQESLRQAIWHERRIELAMEHERFFDLVRWGIAASTLHAAGKSGFTAGVHELLPIPQTQIDLSKGVLTQNHGY